MEQIPQEIQEIIDNLVLISLASEQAAKLLAKYFLQQKKPG